MLDCSTLKSCSATVSTSADRRVGAYELKFLLSDAMADQVLESVRLHLPADPHSDPARGDGYRVNSLYFDTADLDTYHRLGSYRRRKFRLRRYGSDSRVFLERKSKSRGLVRKRRTIVSDGEVALLDEAELDSAWPGYWYQQRLLTRRLAPVCNVSYERVARVGMTPEGPIRFTVDRQVRCRPADGLSVPFVSDGAVMLTGLSIVEMKYRIAMPALFKGLIHDFSLTPGKVSKYRLSIETCRLNEPLSPVSPAVASVSERGLRMFPLTAVGCG